MAEQEPGFTGYVIEADGGVRLDGRDERGHSFSLRLSLDQVGSLAMTLPAVVERALRVRYGDESLRYVYGVGSWTLETASDADVLILSLATVDGFNASFGLQRSALSALAEALVQEHAPAAPRQRALPRRH